MNGNAKRNSRNTEPLLTSHPVPLTEVHSMALDYHSVPIDLQTTLSREPLIRLQDFNIASQSYYARSDGHNPPYFRSFRSAPPVVQVRRSVAEKLLLANEMLRAYDVEVFVLDGYRPIELQRELWASFMDEARMLLGTQDEEQLVMHAGKYCSDPRNFDESNMGTWPVHTTGGAIDVTLRSLQSQEVLYMGGIFDDASDVSHTDYYERVSEGGSGSGQSAPKSASHVEACKNRRLLYNALTAVEFANYPYEWWHFDYKTQMWAINRINGGNHSQGTRDMAEYGYLAYDPES